MSKTVTICGHEVQIVYDASIGDDHQESTLQYIARRVADGDREGEMIESRWKIVNPDAEKWKSIAKKLYDAVISADEWSIYHLTTACNEYTEAIKEQ